MPFWDFLLKVSMILVYQIVPSFYAYGFTGDIIILTGIYLGNALMVLEPAFNGGSFYASSSIEVQA